MQWVTAVLVGMTSVAVEFRIYVVNKSHHLIVELDKSSPWIDSVLASFKLLVIQIYFFVN